MIGHWAAELQKRELGWAALPGAPTFQGSPSHVVIAMSGGSSSASIPSQNTPPDCVMATLVKMVLRLAVDIATGLVLVLVPGATAKNPASGLIARRRPSASNLVKQRTTSQRQHHDIKDPFPSNATHTPMQLMQRPKRRYIRNDRCVCSVCCVRFVAYVTCVVLGGNHAQQ